MSSEKHLCYSAPYFDFASFSRCVMRLGVCWRPRTESADRVGSTWCRAPHGGAFLSRECYH